MCQVPRRLMLDLRPLRVSPAYRRMWGGWTVAQVGQSIHELDQTTQQNAALVEQTAAASHMMREQAQTLTGDVARFRLP